MSNRIKLLIGFGTIVLVGALVLTSATSREAKAVSVEPNIRLYSVPGLENVKLIVQYNGLNKADLVCPVVLGAGMSARVAQEPIICTAVVNP